jgi:hypothetical protein
MNKQREPVGDEVYLSAIIKKMDLEAHELRTRVAALERVLRELQVLQPAPALREPFWQKTAALLSGAPTPNAQANLEAQNAELRRALERISKGCDDAGTDPYVAGEDTVRDVCREALAQPAPQAALRAMLVKAAYMGGSDSDSWPSLGPEGVADAVLRGES